MGCSPSTGVEFRARGGGPTLRRVLGQSGLRSWCPYAPWKTRPSARPTPRPPRAQSWGPPYLQAVGAWLRRRRRLVRLEEDLLAPPEELDNSDEDVVQHQDHARSRPPARRPGRCARSARPRQLRRVRARVRPGPAPARPLPAPRPRGPAYPPSAASCASPLVRPADPPRSPSPPGSHLPFLSVLKTLPACPLLGSPTR